MYNGNRLKLGLFGFNCEGGMAITTAPENWSPTWENNIEVARKAEQAGLEFVLPIGRWRGYGGKSDFQGISFETITWAAGLLAHTSALTVFGTIHAPMFHPIVAAKQMATVDLLSEGRFGLNLVCGWNQDEFDMFGKEQLEHDARYEYGQEWLDVVRTVWREDEPVSFDGRFFELNRLIGRPKPYAGSEPVLMNAGYSPAGRAFAMRNCEFLLTSLIDVESGRRDVDEVQEAARRDHGRHIDLIGTAYVVCRPTRDEAEEFHRHYAVEHADWEAADHLMELARRARAVLPARPLPAVPPAVRRRPRHVSDRGRPRPRRRRARAHRRCGLRRARVLLHRLRGRARPLPRRGAPPPRGPRAARAPIACVS